MWNKHVLFFSLSGSWYLKFYNNDEDHSDELTFSFLRVHIFLLDKKGWQSTAEKKTSKAGSYPEIAQRLTTQYTIILYIYFQAKHVFQCYFTVDIWYIRALCFVISLK